MTAEGWCGRRRGDNYGPDEHDGGFMHRQSENCAGFVSDREHTQLLIRLAAEQDRRSSVVYSSGATDPAAAFVDEHIGR